MFFEEVLHYLLFRVSRNGICYGILFSCALSMCGKVFVVKLWSKMLSANQILDFMCHLLN